MAEQITVTPARSGGAIASAPDGFRFRRGGGTVGGSSLPACSQRREETAL